MEAPSTLLVDLASAGSPDRFGYKAVNLSWLIAHGVRVPPGFVLPVEAARGLAAGDGGARAVREALLAELSSRLETGNRYAVRSSATFEDTISHSFAGQLRSVLDVSGADAVVSAMEHVIASAGAPELLAYAERAGIDTASLGTGVIVQRMVDPRVSGIAFSKSPLTGLNEVVIEAIPGRGDALAQDGVTPDRWIHRWGDLIERPAEPRTDVALIEDVAREVRSIATAFGRPADLEWVSDGAALHWVQIRPIVGIDQIRLYSNRIAREVMPGIIHPLTWSVNTPIVNRAWIDLFTEAIGRNDIRPDQLAKPFGYRAYFNMSVIGDIFVALGMPRESLELLLGLPAGSERPRFRGTRATLRHLPRMLRLGWRLNRYDRRLARELPALRARYRELAAVDLAALADDALLAHIDRIARLVRRSAYTNIVTPLLMNAYGALVRRRVAARGLDPAIVDPARDEPGIHDHDPRPALEALAEVARSLDDATRDALRRDGAVALQRPPEVPVPAAAAAAEALDRLRQGFDAFMARFGHLGDSGLDLTAPRWREDPDLIVRMILDTQPSPPRTSLAWGDVRRSFSVLQRPLMGRIFRRAATYRRLREEVGSDMIFGYGLFRPAFLELGARLTARGLLARPDDTFLLTLDELRALAAPRAARVDALLATRRAELAEAPDLDLPELIVGEDYVPRRRAGGLATVLEGTPSSRGTYRGAVRVIRSGAEFDQLQPGEVLVVPYSDVAWTPLFARAGAVVAESGGMLSHSSIVAREYGIPCVVSVPGACDLPNGVMVHVDGYRGIVTVESGDDARG